MTLRLIREPSVAGATLGVLLVNGHFCVFTLEDAIREVPWQPVEAWKVKGQTAIPSGRYQVRVTWSPRFQRPLPELLNVPGFSGIRIHAGNRAIDTEGCVLVGLQRAHAVIRESRPAVEVIQSRIAAAEARNEPVWIEIENPKEAA